MKYFLILPIFFLTAYSLKAQNVLWGKSQKEIRDFFNNPSLHTDSSSKTKSLDIFYLRRELQEDYYYHDGVCFLIKQVWSEPSIELMKNSMASEKFILSQLYKDAGNNTWTANNGEEKIELKVTKNKNQYIVTYSGVKK